MVERNLLLCTSLIFLVLACGRGVDKVTSSSVTIRIPGSLSSSGMGTMAALPVGRDACYGINIIVAGPSNTNTCGPTTGIVSGFVEAGDSVTASVPSKSTVTIQLFLYLKAVGDTGPCPLFMPYIPTTQIENTYLVGESPNVFIDGADMSVTINGTFPGVSQNIAQTLALPSTCLPTTPSVVMSVSAGAQTLTGTGINMTARAGKPMGQLLSGAGIKLIVR